MQIGRACLASQVRLGVGITIATLILTGITAAQSATAPTMTIESGDNQLIDQNRELVRPFQVRLIDTADRGVPDVAVTFTAARNNGLNAPEVVATSSVGIATYQPGFFRNPGTHSVTASAPGFNSVTFTVVVADTPNDFDGNYFCTTYQGLASGTELLSVGSHEFTIFNNALVKTSPAPFYEFDGTYLPATQQVSGYIGTGNFGYRFNPTTITLDTEGTARVDGSFQIAQQDGGLQERPRNWRCIRK